MSSGRTAQRQKSEDSDQVKSPIQAHLERLHTKFAKLQDGQIATYIPELSKAYPNWFGIRIATTYGRVFEVGCPFNPIINAGEDKMDRNLRVFSTYAGRELSIDTTYEFLQGDKL